jgi:hypothetical protein
MLSSRSGERGGLGRWGGLVVVEAMIERWSWRTHVL